MAQADLDPQFNYPCPDCAISGIFQCGRCDGTGIANLRWEYDLLSEQHTKTVNAEQELRVRVAELERNEKGMILAEMGAVLVAIEATGVSAEAVRKTGMSLLRDNHYEVGPLFERIEELERELDARKEDADAELHAAAEAAATAEMG